MFPIFPRGRLGLGLLLLRITAAGFIISFEGNQLMSGLPGVLACVPIVLAVLVAMGWLTSLSSSIVGGLVVIFFFTFHPDLTASMTIAGISIAIAMMGGGAYSIDGLIHGRRRVFVPKS